MFGTIRHQREKYCWEFVFLGANQDAIQEAVKIGIAPDAALTFADNGASAEAAFGATSSLIQTLRQEPSAPVAFTDEDRQTQGRLLDPRIGQPNSSSTIEFVHTKKRSLPKTLDKGLAPSSWSGGTQGSWAEVMKDVEDSPRSSFGFWFTE